MTRFKKGNQMVNLLVYKDTQSRFYRSSEEKGCKKSLEQVCDRMQRAILDKLPKGSWKVAVFYQNVPFGPGKKSQPVIRKVNNQ